MYATNRAGLGATAVWATFVGLGSATSGTRTITMMLVWDIRMNIKHGHVVANTAYTVGLGGNTTIATHTRSFTAILTSFGLGGEKKLSILSV